MLAHSSDTCPRPAIGQTLPSPTKTVSKPLYTKLFINGEWVESRKNATFPLFNPTTEEFVADVHEADASDVDVAYEAAKAAFPKWRDTFVFERVALCERFADLIERDRDEIAELEANNVGIPTSVYQIFITATIQDMRHMASLAHTIHGETSLNTPGCMTYTLRQPFGVCGAIMPWNLPILMFCQKVIPCIVTGNTLLLKPSEKAPLTCLKLAALAAEAGFPPGVLNVLPGFGPKAGAALSAHMGIAKITFTGSTATGRRIIQAAAQSNMKRVCVECGGKNPAVIFDDADLVGAVKTVTTSICVNSGQICLGNSRIHVHKNIFVPFVEALKGAFESLKVGDPHAQDTFLGPLVDKVQFENVLRYVEVGKAEGANVVTGGDRGAEMGYFVKPTIFTNVPADSTILQNEIFGPIVAVEEFVAEEEVLKKCNDTQYGLHATVFTQDVGRSHRIVQGFEAGMVTVNCGSEVHPYDLSFGGWKQSGIGRENGQAGLDSYYETKTVTIKTL